MQLFGSAANARVRDNNDPKGGGEALIIHPLLSLRRGFWLVFRDKRPTGRRCYHSRTEDRDEEEEEDCANHSSVRSSISS